MFVATGADGAHGYAGASAALMQGSGERAVTAEILETLALDERRAAIAVVIGAQVRRRSCGLYPELADQVTAMLMQMPIERDRRLRPDPAVVGRLGQPGGRTSRRRFYRALRRRDGRGPAADHDLRIGHPSVQGRI